MIFFGGILLCYFTRNSFDCQCNILPRDSIFLRFLRLQILLRCKRRGSIPYRMKRIAVGRKFHEPQQESEPSRRRSERVSFVWRMRRQILLRCKRRGSIPYRMKRIATGQRPYGYSWHPQQESEPSRRRSERVSFVWRMRRQILLRCKRRGSIPYRMKRIATGQRPYGYSWHPQQESNL